MLEKIYIIPHIWTRKLQEAILFSWPHESTYPYTQQCLAVSFQKISKDQPPSWMKRAWKWFSVACNHYGLQPRLAGMGQLQGSQGIFPCFLPKGYQRLARQETYLGQWLGKWLRGNPWKSWKTSGSLRSFSPNPLEDLERFGQTDRIWQINLDLDLVWRIDAVAFKRRIKELISSDWSCHELPTLQPNHQLERLVLHAS